MSRQEKVGRGHPPVDHQFGRGQRRARGRPPGAVGEKAIVQKIARELHSFKQNGETGQITTYELLLKSMLSLAMSADLRASKWLSAYQARMLPEPDDGVALLVVPEPMPPDKFVEKMMFLNRFATNPELNDDPLFRPVR
jgi:hypothetical protein